MRPASRECGQDYWAYKGNYWVLRVKKELKDKGDIF